MQNFDAVVVGAGPGGATAAAFLARRGLRTLLLDRRGFPRDKVCGDAVSGKSMGVLRRLGIERRVSNLPHTVLHGVTFGAPGGDEVSIPFGRTGDVPGFVCRRTAFDGMLLESAQDAGAEISEKSEVRRLLRRRGCVVGVEVHRRGSAGRVSAPIVIGADGAYSAVARDLGLRQMHDRHYVAGLRAYYEGFNGTARPDYVELHFVEELLPGYFWIFRLPDGAANVGVGMLSSAVKRHRIRLKSVLDRVVRSPRFAGRFAGARRVGPVVGWGLPLGSKPRPMAGDGWMLVGDAASLIDPFTGEGIGNAMLSGMVAAEHACRAHAAGDFSAARLKAYEAQVLGELKSELRISHALQWMLTRRRLVDFVIRRASRSDELASLIACMFDDLGARRRLLSPLFYLRMLRAGRRGR